MCQHEIQTRLQGLSEMLVRVGGATAEGLVARARRQWQRWNADVAHVQAAIGLLLDERARAQRED
jgi:hypothetical protein